MDDALVITTTFIQFIKFHEFRQNLGARKLLYSVEWSTEFCNEN